MSLRRQSMLNGVIVPQIVLDLVDEADTSAHPTPEGPYLESGKFFMDPDITDDEDGASKYLKY